MIRVFNQYVSLKSVFLIPLEGALLVLCLFCAARLRFWNDPLEFELYTFMPDFGVQVLVHTVVFQLCFYYNDLYDPHALRRRSEHLLRLWQALGAACLLLGFLYFVAPGAQIGRGIFFINLILLTGSLSVSRAALDFAWRATAPAQRILIVGSGNLASTVSRELTRRDDLNARIAGFVDGRHSNDIGPPASLLAHPILGSVEELERIVAENKISKIVVALEDHRGMLPVRSLVNLRVHGTPVEDAHTTLAALTGRVWLETVRPSWFVYSEGFHRSRLTAIIKRAIDICLGMAGLILSAPLMALIAAVIRLDSPGPALFRQTRVGLGGRPFELLKFRSMRTDAEAQNGAQWALQNDPRATRVGRFLRKYRLDELPQFLNVIRGQMSFVGPRPERPCFVNILREKIPYYDERHSVRLGVTGWAQVQYAYGASVEDACRKLEYDLFYLKNMSFLFDCAIVLRTIRIVLVGQGAR